MSRRVLVAPMDWGLGHATRCVAVIRALLDLQCTVFVAGSGPSLTVLREEFPSLPHLALPGYNPQYSRSPALMRKLMSQLPGFINTIRLEHRVTEEIVKDHGIDLIVSDNRYGCRSGNATSIFMGHQLNLRLSSGVRWTEPVVNQLHRWFVKRFDSCWVPDWKGEHSLAGDLSQSAQTEAVYLGPLSRFQKLQKETRSFDLAIILSGPEPQRTLLEKRIIAVSDNLRWNVCLVRGVRDRPLTAVSPHMTVVDYADSETLGHILAKSEVVLARSGYSTIMDLAHTGGKAVFVPTPGQPEQEYLAQRMAEQGIAGYVSQDELDLNIIIEKSLHYRGFEGIADGHTRLCSALREVLKI